MKNIHWRDHKTYCLQILDAIRFQKIYNPHSRLDTGSGWSGPKDLFSIPVVQPLIDFIQLETGCDQLTGWANVLENGDYIGPHHHNDGKNSISGIYYLTPGILETDKQFTIHFRPGDIALFDPSLNHWVDPSTYDFPRITIAFNGVK